MNDSFHQLAAAIDAAKEQFARWQQQGLLSRQELAALQSHYEQMRNQVDPERDYSANFPPTTSIYPEVQRAEQQLRGLEFLERELRQHHHHGRLMSGVVQACGRDLLAQLAAKRVELERLTLQSPEPPLGSSTPSGAHFAGGQRNVAEGANSPARQGWIERLLDPRSLQILMMCGGGLLVLGLVTWLWSIGLFANRVVMAVTLGGANLGLLTTGALLVRCTRYQTAGRAVTLLACLVLPLNLWFYNAQGLITLKEGGHLWVPALVCCAIYAGVARLLKDAMFVYTLVGGIVLTGLLILADQQIGRFWEIVAPSTLLVAIGTIAIHVERLFAPGEGPFSREKFGLAFYRAGHLALGAGLALLLGGQVAAWCYDPWLAELVTYDRPALAADGGPKLAAMLLALVGAYGYFYSLMVVERDNRLAYSGMFSLLWAEAMLIELAGVLLTPTWIMAILAATALVALAAVRWMQYLPDERGRRPLLTTTSGVALGCTLLAIAVGLFEWFPVHYGPELLAEGFTLTWLYAGVLLAIAAVAAFGAATAHRLRQSALAAPYRHGAVLAATLAALTVVSLAGVPSLIIALPILALAPLAILIAIRGLSPALHTTLVEGAQVALAILAAVGLTAIGGLLPYVAHQELLLGAFFIEAAIGFAIASRYRLAVPSATLAVASATAAVWQLLLAVNLGEYAPMMAASLVGLGGLATSRLALTTRTDKSQPLASDRWAVTSLVFVVVGSVAGLLLSLNRIGGGGTEWGLLALNLLQGGIAIASAALVADRQWRRTMGALIGFHVGAAVLVLNIVVDLTGWQRLELFVTAGGMLLLAAGHVGWRREGERRDPQVTLYFALGSLLSAVPLLIGLLTHRFGAAVSSWQWVALHEVGLLAISLALLASGILGRIRWTTMVGGATLAVYVLSLAALVDVPDRLQNVAVYMMIGGGAFFATAVLLSIYRDRLLALPRKISQKEGVFQVLGWR